MDRRIYRVSPLRDPRWASLVERHPQASVFHSPEWLEAIWRTYGYEIVGFTTARPDQDLTNGIVFCRIQSWLTGERMVSLPFSDHCQPLVEDGEDFEYLTSALVDERAAKRWRYIEIRSIGSAARPRRYVEEGPSLCLHRLDLRRGRDELARHLHKDCVQRKIRRARREALTYEKGRSAELLQKFYRLLVLTRRRQHLPPQPMLWFRNLVACMGDKLTVRIASKNGQPVAGNLTLSHRNTLVYKYSCSDKRFSSLGGTQLLLWQAIEEAQQDGLQAVDLGRSEMINHGLVAFKDRWGATRLPLTYLRSSAARSAPGTLEAAMGLARPIIAVVPNFLMATAGKALYRHFG